jgi:Mg-chelatase subunit ChlD
VINLSTIPSMKNSHCILASIAAALSAATVNAAPAAESARPRIEVCFVLDTTGSMGGLIEGAKQKIWSIANEIIAAKPTPTVRYSLVGYRDRGDEYVTKLTALTEDLDAVYADLQKFQAGGGGDTPESVSQALDEAVRKIAWSADRSVLKIIYLVGDAPPHTDYADGPDYRKVCEDAVKRDLIINTVQCGNIPGTQEIWTEIARRSEGQFVALAQTGNMVVVETPFDARLSELNREMGTTLVGYGSAAARSGIALKQRAAEAAAPSAAADRLAYNIASGGKAVQGEGELLDAINDGRLDIDKLDRDQLPEDWRKLSDAEIRAKIDELKAKRATLQREIAELGKQREEHIAAERRRLAAAGKGDAFDEKVAEIVREQAKRKGISYE